MTGNTETVAGYIAAKTGLEMVDIGDLDGAGVAAFDGLIIGAPTWHTGADTERSGTAWDECAPRPVASASPRRWLADRSSAPTPEQVHLR